MMAPVMSQIDAIGNQVNSVTSQVVQLTEAINNTNKLRVELQQSVVGVQNGMKTMCTVFIIFLVLFFYANVCV